MTSPSSTPAVMQRLPLIIGALVLLGGVALGLRGGCAGEVESTAGAAGSTTSADAVAQSPVSGAASGTASASPTPSATTAAGALPHVYEPDLSGPDVGKLLSARGAEAHALALRDGWLWCIDADGRVQALQLPTAAKPEQGEPRAVDVRVPDDESYGGDLVAASHGVYWVDKQLGTGQDILFRATEPSAEAPAELARATDIGPIAATTDGIAWAAGEALMQLSADRAASPDQAAPPDRAAPPAQPGPQHRATLSGRVVTLASGPAGLLWIETGATVQQPHALWSLPDGAERSQRLTAALASRSRSHLLPLPGSSAGSERGSPLSALWINSAQDDEQREHIIRWSAATPSRSIAITGLVTDAVLLGDTLYFAEIHPASPSQPGSGDSADEDSPDGESPDVVSLLRSLKLDAPAGQRPTRLGRQPGRITALTASTTHLLWSHEAGISQLPIRRPPDPAPAP